MSSAGHHERATEGAAALPVWTRRLPSLRGPLPWGTRVGLLGFALTLFLVACSGGEPAAVLTEVNPGNGPSPITITALEPSSGSPGGGQRVTIVGQGFRPEHVVWFGSPAARVDSVEVSPDGTRLTFAAPATRAGASLDVGVGIEEPGGIVQRAVARGAFTTSGLGATWVAGLAVAIAVLALLGTPLFVVIAATTCLGLYLETQLKPDMGFFSSSGERAGAGANLFISWLGPMGDSPLFIAIPLFTFAGTLMSESRAPTRLINLCRALLGWMPGGLALVTLVTCCFFTAFTGASGVTIIALGGLLFPILLREGYPERFSLGLLTTGGSLGLLFPPSLPVIVYGLVARVEIGRLFQAALIPGILLVVFLAVTAFVVAVRAKVPRHRFTFGELGVSLRGAIWELPLPVLVVGGIYSGLVTAAEAAAVTAFYVILTTVGIYRDVRPAALLGVVRKTAVLVGAILLIMGAALGFTDWLTLEQIPQKILAAMQRHIDDQLTFLIMLNIFLLIVGCLMDIFSATLVVVPLIAPVAYEFGVDPYHLAAIFLVNLEIGYSTPPVGINLFIASLRFRRPVFALYRASVLFIAVLLVALLLITYLPGISLGLFDALPSVEVRAERGGDGGGAVAQEAGAPAVLEVEQYADAKLHATASLGGVTLEQAEAQRSAALKELRAAEERLGLDWIALDQGVREAERAIDEAKDGAARREARARLAAARDARAPLEQVAERMDVARRLVDDLKTMERTVRWRSRLDGTEWIGATFSTTYLAPGTHVITATCQDKRSHVAQAVARVTVKAGADAGSGGGQAAPGGPNDGTGTPDGDWGDGDWGDGDWGDGDWGDGDKGHGGKGDGGEGDGGKGDGGKGAGDEGAGGDDDWGPWGAGGDDAGGAPAAPTDGATQPPSDSGAKPGPGGAAEDDWGPWGRDDDAGGQ